MPVLNSYGFIRGAFLLPPQEDDANLPHDKIPGKTGEIGEPNKHGDLNSPNMAVSIEHDIYGHKFLLIIQEYGHKLWVRSVTMIDNHGTKVLHDPGHIQFINSNNDFQYEKVMSCNKISNYIV